MEKEPVKRSPPEGSLIFFSSATAFVRKIVVQKKPIQLTASHRGSVAMLDNGYLLIDKKWYS